MNSSNMQFQQNMNATIQDLKIQIGQLENSVSHLQSAGSSNLPSQIIPNLRGNVSAVTLRSGKELPQKHLLRPIDANSELDADSQIPQPDKIVPLPFPKLLRMFRKVEINIPLLDAIKQIPKYAKFLKEHIKCRDPKIFSIPCTIGDCTFVNAMLDLGASINVMPTSIYKSLNFGDLEPIRMTIQLANRSVVQPLGVLEDVLVRVNELIFPANFYVLDMEDETLGKGSTLILGRPFLMTKVEIMLAHLVPNPIQVSQPNLKTINDNSSSLPPPMELKTLLSHLKYAYLDAKQQLPIIIANNLHQEHEDKLLQHKKAIRRKLSDLPSINPSICMHKILMEEEARPIRQQQRRLNLTILDVVKKEVTKLLAARIIYPISDS
ncbi:hypothetical protein CR513_07398, partial [Mucuna pruriens]